jgi:DNA polymerase III epsilon subunit-like protein
MTLPPFAVLDTETPGLLKEADARVIEIGVARFEDGVCVRRFQRLVRPDVLTDAGAEVAWRVSQLARADIEAAPLPEDVWESMGDLLDNVPVVAWNLPFDQAMVQRSFFCAGRLETMIQRKLLSPSWKACAMRRFSEAYADYGTRWPNGEAKWFRLSDAAELMGLEWTGDAHRADADAEMTGRLYAGMLAGTLTPRQPVPMRHDEAV